jgi:hypothetical protein
MDLKYGCIDSHPMEEIKGITKGLAASTVLPAKSGRFVVYDVSNAAYEAIATDAAAISAYVEQVVTAAQSTATKNTAKPALFSVKGKTFEVPFARAGAAYTLTQAILDAIMFLQIDSYVDTNGIQYGDDANSGSIGTQHLYLVVGGNVDRGTVFVQVVDANITSKA